MAAAYKSSIKRRVMAVILMACTAVLLVTVAAFIAYDLMTFREAMIQNLVSQGQLIADNCTAAVAFKDRNAATNVLYSLRSEPHIIAAAVYDEQGKIFVTYPEGISIRSFPA